MDGRPRRSFLSYLAGARGGHHAALEADGHLSGGGDIAAHVGKVGHLAIRRRINSTEGLGIERRVPQAARPGLVDDKGALRRTRGDQRAQRVEGRRR
jgi:hypothetical protein